jgi:energy-coupling factor transporter ATP-binding protein EcfA2
MDDILHLTRIVIDNFRGIDHLELALDCSDEEGGLAVLAGDNGCGKTTVLEAILLLLYRSDLFVSDVPLEQQVRLGQEDFFIQADTRTGPFRSTSLREMPAGDRPGQVKPLIFPDRFLVEYFSMNRDLARPEPGSAGDHGSDIASLRRRLVNVYNRSARRGQLGASPFARMQRAMQRFLGPEWVMDVLFVDDRNDADPEVVFRDGELPEGVTSVAEVRRLALNRPMPRVITLAQLSAGQLALFSFIGPLIFRQEEEYPLVLIDEPERHLHPSWQRVLLPALRELSPRSQFIVATHSMEILESAMSYERHLLLRNDDPRAKDWQPPLREAGE